MNFGEQIKGIRTEQGLTQAQFAEKLNVTRQAVSNWENDKNLPDIEMLIQISDVFQISLDQLIKGETGDETMNNMTEKIIRDGSETRRARYNMVTSIIGGFFILLGIIFIIIKGLSVEYIDAAGVLHENFFLLPLGFFSIFCGLILFLSVGIRTLVHRIRTKKQAEQ